MIDLENSVKKEDRSYLCPICQINFYSVDGVKEHVISCITVKEEVETVKCQVKSQIVDGVVVIEDDDDDDDNDDKNDDDDDEDEVILIELSSGDEDEEREECETR